ncbi:MAG: arginine repressor [Lachnospiraceae bacterium]|nr:arginine repressor [Lachnospiraceae bacterium]
MKRERHNKIIELIEQYNIGTQQELSEKLQEAGYDVTQSTVSRDIRQLHLSKVPAEKGMKKYALLRAPARETDADMYLGDKYIRVLKDGFVSADMAGNILVVKTVSGMAMAVAAAIDAMEFDEIVGSIAGDDTIMMAVRSVEDNKILMEKLKHLI